MSINGVNVYVYLLDTWNKNMYMYKCICGEVRGFSKIVVCQSFS